MESNRLWHGLDLKKLYWEDSLSIQTIADMASRSKSATYSAMSFRDIPYRSNKERLTRLRQVLKGIPSSLRGQPRPQEVIDRITAAWTEAKKLERARRYTGEGNPCFGRKRPEEEKQMISETTIIAMARLGYGVGSPYPYEFYMVREAVLERDSYTCQHCGSTEGLHIHHIDRDKQNNAMGNLVVLCRCCHPTVEQNYAAEGGGIKDD